MQPRTPGAAVAAASLLASVAAAAQDGVTVSPVVVTATRTAQTADETLASVSVVTREDIERLQPESVTTLLGRLPGVEYTRNGGRGKTNAIFMRGTESDHVVVLVDGVRIGSATTGTAAFEQLPLANIERIEVVRGPRSSLYGADAIGGVIQIFTRRSDQAHASVGAGSDALRTASAGYGRNTEAGDFSVDFSHEETEGFDARDNTCALCADEPDDDGFESTSASFSGSHRLSPDYEVSARALLADSETEFDGSFQNSSENEQVVLSARLDARLSDAWDTRLQLGTATDDNVNFLDGNRVSHFETRREELTWKNDVVVGTGLLTAGIDAGRAEVDSSTDYDETKRETIAAFVQRQWNSGDLTEQVNIRHEYFDDFGHQTTGSVAFGYRFGEATRLFGSLGTAFKAPTFNELYFPGFGNPDLEPERSRAAELGLRGSAGTVAWEATAYRTELEDLIDTVNVGGGIFGPRNVESAEIDGLELSANAAWDRLRADVRLTYKDPRNANTGNRLRRRARRTLDAGIDRSWGTWSVGADLAYRGDRFEDAANTTRLDAYTLLDLRASWRFAPDWRSSFKVSNVTDEDYVLVETYNTAGRSVYVELTWRPGREG